MFVKALEVPDGEQSEYSMHYRRILQSCSRYPEFRSNPLTFFGKGAWNNSGIRDGFQRRDEGKPLSLGSRSDRFWPLATGRPAEGLSEADMRNVGLSRELNRVSHYAISAQLFKKLDIRAEEVT